MLRVVSRHLARKRASPTATDADFYGFLSTEVSEFLGVLTP